jgi:hypothetical protein
MNVLSVRLRDYLSISLSALSQKVLVLFWLVVVGPKTIIANMSKEKSKGGIEKYKLQQIIELLKFALSLEDQEIIKSTVESIIEILEEETSKYQ